MINFLIVTHGEFGAYLIEAAESIVGRQDDGIRAVSISPRLSLSEMRAHLKKDVEELRKSGGLIVLIDMPGGTPGNLSIPLVDAMPDVSIVSGVNLYMLISAFRYRAHSSVAELTERLVKDGQKSIQDIRLLFKNATHCAH